MQTLGSFRSALAVSVGIPFLIATSAYAQDPAPANTEATTERVVVTGSYIPTAEEVTASPLDTMTSQDVNRSGSSDVLKVLQQRNPDFVGGGNLGSTNANISAGNTLGGSFAQIRGFPTLVLYDGRRIADAAALAVGGAQFSDIGLFPAALISRIEVLKDGASTAYGSDAVGGVINIFTKDEYQGAELGFRYGTTTESAVNERRGYAISGIGNDATQVTFGMQYYEMDGLFQREREYSALTQFGTTTFGGHVNDNSGPPGPGRTIRYIPDGYDFIDYPGQAQNSPFDTGIVPGTVTGGFANPVFDAYYQRATQADNGPNDVLRYNLGKVPTSTLDTARTNVVAAFNHQIFGKKLELFGNFMYSNSDYQSFLNAQPISVANGIIIPAGRVGTNDDVNSAGYVPGVTNTIYNPFPYEISTRGVQSPTDPGGTLDNGATLRQRYQTNPRIFDNSNNFYRFLGGLRSQVTEDWFVEAAAFYSKYDIAYTNSNLVILDGINALIAGTAVGLDGVPIPALDFFALNPIGSGPGQLTAGQFGTAFGANIRQLSSFQRAGDLKIVGTPFSLPGGKVGFAIGAEYRVEGFKVKDSPEIFISSVPIQEINKSREIKSAFVETTIPIVGSSMNVPFVYNLELGVSGRFDRYEGVSEDAKVWKVALRYQPIKDLTLRSTYSTSFIAPNLYQQIGPSSTGFSQGLSFGGIQQDQAQVIGFSNPLLNPSKAETYTAGLVYSPSYIPGLTVQADYFRILQLGIVGGLGGNTILQSVNNLGLNSPYADLVAFFDFPGSGGAIDFNNTSRDELADAGILERDGMGGFINPNTQAPVGPDLAGALNGNLSATFYEDTQNNLGAQRTEGFDLSARYNIDLRAAGQLELGINAVIFTLYDFKTNPTSAYYNLLDLNGTEFFGVIPEYKLNFLAEYRVFGFTLSLNANYIPETLSAVGRDPELEDQTTFDLIEDYWQVDGRLSYTFKGRTTAAAVVDAKDSKDAKGGALTTAAGAETMSPVQKLLDGLTLTVGCNNIFDEQPPFIAGGNSNTNLAVYDPFGQFVYFEISKKF